MLYTFWLPHRSKLIFMPTYMLMFKDAISVPGITLRYLFKSLPNVALRKTERDALRRTLVGCYKGENILLVTSLLKWCLDTSLKVTRIYHVIEYQSETCFGQFGKNKVSEAIRKGDHDDTHAIKSETMKLLGNAAYSKTLTNKQTLSTSSMWVVTKPQS